MKTLTVFLFIAVLGVCTPFQWFQPPKKMSLWGIMGIFKKVNQAYEDKDVLELLDLGLATAEVIPGLNPQLLLAIKVTRANIGALHPAVLKATHVMFTVKEDLEQFSCPALLEGQHSHIQRM